MGEIHTHLSSVQMLSSWQDSREWGPLTRQNLTPKAFCIPFQFVDSQQFVSTGVNSSADAWKLVKLSDFTCLCPVDQTPQHQIVILHSYEGLHKPQKFSRNTDMKV